MEFEMYVYKQNVAVKRYTGSSREVEIPEQWEGLPVTEICQDAFSGNETLETVIFPAGLCIIGANAFRGCTGLTRVDSRKKRPAEDPLTEGEGPGELTGENRMPNSLQVVETGAFQGSGIHDIRFHSRELKLGDGAFAGCPDLGMVALLGRGVLTMGDGVFRDSGIFGFLSASMRMESLPDNTFLGCSRLSMVSLNTTQIGDRSFYGCGNLRILRGRTRIRTVGAEAFFGCNKLNTTAIPGLRSPRETENAPEEAAFLEMPEPIPFFDDVPEVLPPARKVREEPQAPAACTPEEKTADVPEEAPVEQTAGKTPLFSMTITHRGGGHGGVPARIRGNWHKVLDGYIFCPETPSWLRESRMTALPCRILTNLAPLLEHLSCRRIRVCLYGDYQGGTYRVYDMEPADTDPFSRDISPELFREMLNRLKKAAPAEDAPQKAGSLYTLRKETDVATFIQICGDRLPLWVRNAYRRNCDIITAAGGKRNDDEVKHANRAKEMLLNIDWDGRMGDIPTVEEAKAILDASFFGMEEVKTRVMEVVAQIRRTGTLPKWGILLHGPAGTGKTTIAKAIARLLSLGMIQMDMSSLGEDPESISGSSRIYSNARPGMLLEAMFQIRSSAAVLVANEVDKAFSGKGSRSAADILLTILDKTGFYENFLEEVVPTDNLFCIGTCNDLSRISKPLLDRFLVIHIPAYTPAEKEVIFRDYILPLAQKRANILPEQMSVTEEAVALLAAAYATEPGARDLEQYAERFVGDYCRLADTDTRQARVYTEEDVRSLFGPGGTVVHSYAINPGEVNAAFCHNGRASFFLVEASVVPGTGKFEVLGPVAKIQEDYAKAAYLCVKNTASCDLRKYDVSLFIPHSVPDGADNHIGFACYAAICSRLLGSNLAVRDICLIGGCDMNGSLYYDESDLTPLLRAMKARGVSTLYAPMGTSRLIDARVNCDCGITVIEGPDARTLFSLAATHGNLTH